MKYDLIVIGSGPGGYVAAIRASQLGLKLLLEDGIAEGTPNRGGAHGLPMPAERFPYMPCIDTDYEPVVPLARDHEESYPKDLIRRVLSEESYPKKPIRNKTHPN